MRSRWFDLSGDAGNTAASAAETDIAPPSAVAAPEIKLPSGSGVEQRFALLIGNAAYASAALANPVRDVRLLGWTLEGMGFSVRRVENATLATMQDAIIAFGEQLDAAGADAIALLYFAGHGVQHEGSNFLLPVDARIPAPHYLATRSLPLDVAVAQLARCPRRATIVAVDACRDEVVADTAAGATGVTAGLARARLPRPSQLVFSTAAQARAADGWGDHSPFALALSEELPGLLVPGRRLQDMIDDVATKVGLWTKGEQTVSVYREGFMPPLALTEADEQRLRDWSRRPPFRLSRRQAVRRAAASLAALGVIAAAALWWTAYPETRTTLLLRAGLLDSAAYDLTCGEPWDGPADAYGLTRRDWCQSVPRELIEKLASHAGSSERVAAGLREGDPKAVLLSAGLAARDAYGMDGPAREARLGEAYLLAERAARTDLPLGAIAPFLIASSIYTAQTGPAAVAAAMRKAAENGVLVAAVLAPVVEASLRSGGIDGVPPEALDEVEAALRQAAAGDSSGEVAYYAAQNFGGQGVSPVLFSPERERAWLLKSVAAGYPPAVSLLLSRAESDPAYRLEPGERDRLIGLLAGRDDAAGRYWQARQRIGRDGRIGPETLALATAAAKAGFEPATLDLADYYLAEGQDPERALALLRAAAKAGQPAAILRLGLLLANGRAGTDDHPPVAPELQEAIKLLEQPEVAKDLRGGLALAQIYLYGDIATRDPKRAEALLRELARATPEPQIGLDARGELDRIAMEEALRQVLDPSIAIAAGRPDAPLLLTLALPPACGECGLEALLQIVEPFLASGDARLALVPLRNPGSEADIEAALLTVCVAPDGRLGLFRKLVAAAPEWRDVTDGADRARVFAELLKREGQGSIDLAACLSNGAARAALQRQRNDLTAATGLRTSPVLFIGGEWREEADALPRDELRRLILAQLPPARRIGSAGEAP
ncbi:Caspase domain-containing protein [Pseudoxanthobacter soli DSM 19599]|uniref:Caspase domain-containing protein n=1 Tax=Pseudoxanthobacter soli DSM 19599 TaxID=1123029 RepID=A0A1M7ZQT9_9HYPH|nr:caspase family protein [Pseudoxanthobacter soli]SHO67016.1 Caspase domain-containing protein [Pseudoxanthobacter soli DSM 19599]